MTGPESTRFRIAWISLGIIGVAVFAFGLIVAVWPGSSDALFLRATGVASIGMGLFGVLITVKSFRNPLSGLSILGTLIRLITAGVKTEM